MTAVWVMRYSCRMADQALALEVFRDRDRALARLEELVKVAPVRACEGRYEIPYDRSAHYAGEVVLREVA